MAGGGNKLLNRGWFDVRTIDDRTYAVSEPGHRENVNVFLLEGDDRAALIDTGLGVADVEAVVRALTDRPVLVLTSHVDWDHLGSHGAFGGVAVHSGDVEEREGGRFWLENDIPGRYADPVRQNFEPDDDGTSPFRPERVPLADETFADGRPVWFDPGGYQIYTGRPDRLLEDGDRIDLGDRDLQVLHTPGHAPGHCCFHEPDRGYLFTADLVYCADIYLQSGLAGTSRTDFQASIERMDDLDDVDWLFPGHEQYCVSPDLVTTIRRYLEDRPLASLGPVEELPDPWSGTRLLFENPDE